MISTAIVMSDNRPPALGSARATTLSYPALAFAINAIYACEHGYDLLYYQMAAPTCTHASQGLRSASYCKLPAIAHALHRYDVVAFIDSDSFFLDRNLSLPALLARYAPPLAARPAMTAAWFANDLPQLGDRPNGGFHLWYRGSGATRLVRTWWHLPAGKFAVEHDYEQHALQWALGHLDEAVPLLGTLQLHAMADATLSFKDAIAHADHTKAGSRLWVMSLELVAASLTSPSWSSAERSVPNQTLAARRRRKRAALVREARALPSAAEPPTELSQRLMRSAAALLREGFGIGQGLAAGRTEARCSGAGDAGGGAGGTLRVVAYNASAMAREQLPAQGLLGAAGMPLVLLPCAVTGKAEAVAAEVGAPSSAPLQHWRRLGGGHWQLAARSAFCLGIGPRKATKTPYPTLASLHRCPRAGTAGSIAADEAARVLCAMELHGARAGPFHTLAKIGAVRQALRAAASKGHLPDTGESPPLQPRRPPRRRLLSPWRRRLQASFPSASRQLRERKPAGKGRKGGAGKGKPPFWQDGVLKASLAGGEEATHLCLSTWRGQLGVGAAVVFVPCTLAAPAGRRLGGSKGGGAPAHVTALPVPGADGAVWLRLGGEQPVAPGSGGGLCVSARVEGVRWD